MVGNWSGRVSRRPQDVAAQAALDAAVSAFLDLDTRLSYVNDGLAAAKELGGPMDAGGSHDGYPVLDREWQPVARKALDASARYLSIADQYSLIDNLDRPTHVDRDSARRAFEQVRAELAAAATAVDGFYAKHSHRLEDAKGRRAAIPVLAQDARKAAATAERDLTAAESAGLLYPSVLDAAGQLVSAMAALNAAERGGGVDGPATGGPARPGSLRTAAGAVQDAVALIGKRLEEARNLLPTVRSSMRSVQTRIEAVGTRLDTMPGTRSALLREFSADSTADLAGVDDRARASLLRARADWSAAGPALDAGNPEEAAAKLSAARSALASAEADHASLTERLKVLRETKTDPEAAAKRVRFKLRDAQLLVTNRNLIPQWGSVLDAQVDRIDRAAAMLTGPHPNYWGYLQALAAVESFIAGVVTRVRAEAR